MNFWSTISDFLFGTSSTIPTPTLSPHICKNANDPLIVIGNDKSLCANVSLKILNDFDYVVTVNESSTFHMILEDGDEQLYLDEPYSILRLIGRICKIYPSNDKYAVVLLDSWLEKHQRLLYNRKDWASQHDLEIWTECNDHLTTETFEDFDATTLVDYLYYETFVTMSNSEEFMTKYENVKLFVTGLWNNQYDTEDYEGKNYDCDTGGTENTGTKKED
jgi:hypothetical protein